MSSMGKEVGEFAKNLVPNSVDSAVSNITDRPTKTIGDALDSLLFLAFGGVIQRAAKRRISYASELEKFEETVREKTDSIPPAKRIEPNTRIVLNALHDAESCVEEVYLRTMFANLIASSLNGDKANDVHPSFSGILRTMSHDEASILLKFNTFGDLPIVDVSLNSPTGEVCLYRRLCVAEDYVGNSIVATSIAIDGLVMRGLVKIDYVFTLPAECYEHLERTKEIVNLHTQLSLPPNKRMPKFNEYTGIIFTRGVAQLTQLGISFLSVCTEKQ